MKQNRKRCNMKKVELVKRYNMKKRPTWKKVQQKMSATGK